MISIAAIPVLLVPRRCWRQIGVYESRVLEYFSKDGKEVRRSARRRSRFQCERMQRKANSRNAPPANIPKLAGSGTVSPSRENAALAGWTGLPPMTRPDARPVGIKVFIADPALQIRIEGCTRSNDGFRRGQPVEFSARQLYCRHEEIMSGRQNEWINESYVEHNLRACDRAVPACGLIWGGIDAI